MITTRNEDEAARAVHCYPARIVAGTPGRHNGAPADVDGERLAGFFEVRVEATVNIVHGIPLCRARKGNSSCRSKLGGPRSRKDLDRTVSSRDPDRRRPAGHPQLPGSGNVDETIGGSSDSR